MQIFPSRQDFHFLSVNFTVVPVWTEILADVETPVAAYMKLVGDKPGFLLESVEHGGSWSRYSFVGRNALATLQMRNGNMVVSGAVPEDIDLDHGMLGAMESLLSIYKAPVMEELPPLQGGLMGFLGYDIVREIEDLPNAPRDVHEFPDAVVSMIGSLVAFDHWRQRAYVLESVPLVDRNSLEIDAAYDAAIERIHAAVNDLTQPLAYVAAEPPLATDSKPARDVPKGSSFQTAVEAAKEHIRAGDIFQVVLSQRFDIQLGADPFDFYRVLRQVNPSPYMYYMKHNSITIVGSSPEPMVQLRDGKVTSRPIAGTRKRGLDDEHDKKLAAELREHPKEVAEHIMLVDLARNDVGRVAQFGTVKVEELMSLELYSHVMHLTSQVTGQLREGLGPIDVLRATLPAGTVSGAPKVRAMEIIDELEPVRRGPYAGTIGYVDFSGNLDTAIAIRTMFVGPKGAVLQAGAGIVADSVPEDEDLECHNKVAALLAAIPAARRMTAARQANG